MINKIDFKAKNLTSNAGLFLLLENAKSNGIFNLIEIILDHKAPYDKFIRNLESLSNSNILISCAEVHINNVRLTLEMTKEQMLTDAVNMISISSKIYIVGNRIVHKGGIYYEQVNQI